MLCNISTGIKHSTVKLKNTQTPACSTCTNTYSSRLDSRQAEGREEGEIEGRGVKDPAKKCATCPCVNQTYNPLCLLSKSGATDRITEM